MKSQKSLLLGIAALIAITGSSVVAHAADSISPEDSLSMLLQGNAFYARGSLGNLVGNARPKLRKQLAAGQHPYAVVLSCSDSRVPPEIVFDKGLGEIFVVRVAGNVVGIHELGSIEGSIEYAIEHFTPGPPTLVVVLGHEKCGAVTAAVQCAGIDACKADPIGYYKPSSVGTIVHDILPSVQGTDVEASVVKNVQNMVAVIDASPVVEELRSKGHVIEVVGAKYDLDTGIVSLVP